MNAPDGEDPQPGGTDRERSAWPTSFEPTGRLNNDRGLLPASSRPEEHSCRATTHMNPTIRRGDHVAGKQECRDLRWGRLGRRACELGPQGIRVVWLRTTGLPESIPDTGDAVADFGTGFGAGMTRAELIAEMQQETMLDRLPTLAELGNAAAFLASDQASAMTATLANITCGAFLD